MLIILFESYPHGEALRDFHPVACRVLRGKQRLISPAPSADVNDISLEACVGIHVQRDVDWHADADSVDL